MDLNSPIDDFIPVFSGSIQSGVDWASARWLLFFIAILCFFGFIIAWIIIKSLF